MPKSDAPANSTPAPSSVGQRETAWTLFEIATAAAVLLVALVTVSGLLVAYLGIFGLANVAIVTLLLGVPIAVLLFRRRFFRTALSAIRPNLAESSVLLLALLLLGYGTAFRFHEVVGLRDPGVYIASGIELGRTGDFGWSDPVIARNTFYGASPLMQDLVLLLDKRPRWLRLAGFYLFEDGHVEPQFLHGYEVWVALAYSVGGVQATQVLNSAFAALALLVFFCAVRLLARSQMAALLGTLFLAANSAQLWHARSPGNEIMIQALLWGFLFLYAKALSRCETPSADPQNKTLPATSPQSQALLVAAAVSLLATAALVKVAAWLLLPAVAFDFGYQRAVGRLQVSRRLLWLLSVGAAAVAVFHALLFANTYYYGTWKISVSSHGISYFLFPVLLIGGTAAAWSMGILLAPALRSVGRALVIKRRRYLMAAAVAVLLLAAWVWQARQLPRLVAADDYWSEGTNIAEFALYFSPLSFILATAGLALLVARRPTAVGNLFLLLLAGSSLFLIQRNLDASHPWASRRWLPFLFPAFSAGAGYGLALLWRFRPILWPRVLAAAGAAAVTAALLFAAPQLIVTRNYLGAVPALDRLASHLSSSDIVLAHPTGELLRWGPYLKARFDIDLYKHPFVPEESADLYPLLRAEAKAGRRLLYLNDGPLTMTLAQERVFVPIHQETIEYRELEDGLRRPEPAAIVTSQTIHVYQMRPETLDRRWWPGAVEPPPSLPPPRPLPVELRMNAAAAPYLEHFLAADEPTPEIAYRWTTNNGRIYLGDLVQLPLPAGTRVLRVTLRLTSGRPERREPLPVAVYLDHGIRDRERLLATLPAGPDWADHIFEIDPALLRPDSFLELNSTRPPVGDKLPEGKVGCLVQSIRIEGVY